MEYEANQQASDVTQADETKRVWEDLNRVLQSEKLGRHRVKFLLGEEYRTKDNQLPEEVEADVLDELPSGVYAKLMQNVDSIFFQNGDYDPFIGKILLRYFVFRAFTGMEFDGSLDSFQSFYEKYGVRYMEEEDGTDLHVYAMGSILNACSHQSLGFISDAEHKANLLSRKYMIAEEEKSYWSARTNILKHLDNVLTELEAYLDKAGKTLGGDRVPIEDMVSALQNIGQYDEKKVAKAVLDFQMEKAKREQAKAEREKQTQDATPTGPAET